MKKFASIFAITAIISLAMGPMAGATNQAGPSFSPKLNRDRVEVRKVVKQEIREIKQDNKQDRKKILSEKKKKLVERFWNGVQRRLSVLIKNQNKLADRVALRLDKAETNGNNVAELRTKLAAAKVLIVDAENALKSADTLVRDLIKNGSTEDIYAKIKEQNKGVMEKIRTASKALVEIIKNTKGLGWHKPSPTPTATPVPTATPTPTPTI